MKLDDMDQEPADTMGTAIAWVCLIIIIAGALCSLQLLMFPQ